MTSHRLRPWRRRALGMVLPAILVVMVMSLVGRPDTSGTFRLSGIATTGAVADASSGAPAEANGVTITSSGLRAADGNGPAELYPGARVSFVLSVHNTRRSDVSIHDLTVTAGDASAQCDASNLAIDRATGPVTVPAATTNTIGVALRMVPNAPDACKNVVFPLAFSATVTGEDEPVATTSTTVATGGKNAAPTTTSTTDQSTTSTTSPASTTSTTSAPLETASPPETTTTVPSDPPTTAPDTGVRIDFGAPPGTKLSDALVRVTGSGFAPGSTVTIVAHSTPVTLGTAQADQSGDFAATVHLPSDLPPGSHRIEVTGHGPNGAAVIKTEAFTVATGGKLGTVGTTPPGAYAKLVPVQRSTDVHAAANTQTGAVAVLGALGAALGGGAGRGASRSGGASSKDSEGGYLEDVETERDGDLREGRGKGDRSRSWRWRGTRTVDRASRAWPNRLARISPVVGRVVVDGDYLRAMFGSIWGLVLMLAAVLGFVSAASTGFQALPPSLWLMAGVLALSVFDSTVGYVAATFFIVPIALAGGLRTGDELRCVFGVALLWFAVPLAAGAIRPLRRTLHWSLTGVWDRGADLVLAGLFGGWAAMKMTENISGLAGYEMPIDHSKALLALVAMTAIAMRIALETIAAHHYPDRMAAVTHEGDLESGNMQVGLSLIVQISLFVFIAWPYMHGSWYLWVGTAVFFAPLVPWLIADRIPKSSFITKWAPAGLAKWTWVILGGIGLSTLIEHFVHDAHAAIGYGFIFLSLPILTCWALELFETEDEEEDEDEAEEAEHVEVVSVVSAVDVADEPSVTGAGRFPMTWMMRLAGTPVVLFCTWLVLSGRATG